MADNMAATQPITIDQMDAQFGASASPQASAPEASTSPVTVADMDAQFAPNMPKPQSPIDRGVVNGMARIVDKPAEALSDWMAKHGVSAKLRNALTTVGVSQAHANYLVPGLGQQAVNDAADAADFQKTYGQNGAAQVGNLIGQTAVVAPVIASGANVLGGVAGLGSAALADAAPLASRIIQGGSRLLSGTAGEGAPGVAGTATRTASRAAQGATIGGAAAALTGEPVNKGAEYGAVLGPVGHLVGQGLQVAGRVGANLLSPLTDMSANATQRAAVNKLLGAFQADGLTPAEAMQRVADLGQKGMLADVGGANVRSAAETVAGAPGAGSALAQDALESRASGQGARVNQAVKEATGATGNIHAEADQLMAQRAQAAAPLYEKAMANAVVPNEKLATQLQNPLVQQALKDGASVAETNAAANGEAFDPAKYLNPDGSTPAAPTMQALDAVK